ncbi:MAG: hypothetical protein ACFCAD_18905 [Pleurocapsa sp.]
MSKYYYSFDDKADAYSIYLSPQLLLGWLKLITAFLVIIFWKRLYIFFYNIIIYSNQKFTDNNDLAKFITDIQPNFKNAYSIKYQKSDRLTAQEEIESELEAVKYDHLINKDTLVEKVNQLFYNYQRDRINNNLELIKEYTLQPFSSKQNNFDLVYNCKISQIEPLKFEIREELKRFVVQINGKAVNFKLSQKGYVISGQATSRSFSEYWDVGLDTNNKCYLVTIYKTAK